MEAVPHLLRHNQQHVPHSAPSSPRFFPNQLDPWSNLQVTTSHSTHEAEEHTAHPSHYNQGFDIDRYELEQRMQASSSSSTHSRSSSSSSHQVDQPQQNQPSQHLQTRLSRPLNASETTLLAHLDRLKFFLATAPSRWDNASFGTTSSASDGEHPHPALNRFLLPPLASPLTPSPAGSSSNEYVSCVLWSGLYHITGTDIVRALVFRFAAFGRPVRSGSPPSPYGSYPDQLGSNSAHSGGYMKKFEEGVFSDLRNLKPGIDACLEEPKSPFLDLLFKYQCIRTQKKQKVFYWFSVPHDRLFLDALERDLKREKMGLEPCTAVVGEPAASFTYDPKRSLYEQFSQAQGTDGPGEGEGELEAAVRRAEAASSSAPADTWDEYLQIPPADLPPSAEVGPSTSAQPSAVPAPALQTPFFSMMSLFEGSPTYKQRRKKVQKGRRSGLRRESSTSTSPPRNVKEEEHDAMIEREDAGVGYGPRDSRLSAADMFAQQARGEQGPASREKREKERMRKQARLRSMAHVRAGNPALGELVGEHPLSGVQPGVASRGYGANDSSAFVRQPQHAATYPPIASSSTLDYQRQVPKMKAFACPLLTCGRLFKRSEHLKRHLRTHTLERPFPCPRCEKRFSRSDNLTQHLRTHFQQNQRAEEADIEDEGEEEEVRQYEVEVPVQDFDEYGMGVQPQQQDYFTASMSGLPFPQFAPSPEPTPAHWGTPQHRSPAFSTASAPSPQPQRAASVKPASYLRNNPLFDGADYGTSVSAPSHKEAFDQSSLAPYPSSPPSAVGPIRRYRSMTPSLGGRRPMSVGGGMGAGDIGVTRAYHPHPYALSYNSYVSQSSGSAQSSPATYPVQLDYNPQQQASGLVDNPMASLDNSQVQTDADALYAQVQQFTDANGAASGSYGGGYGMPMEKSPAMHTMPEQDMYPSGMAGTYGNDSGYFSTFPGQVSSL